MTRAALKEPRFAVQKYEADARAMIAAREAEGLRPLPLTPEDCNVSSYPGPILQIARLQSSEFWLRATDRTKVAALALWAFAWRQVPAASVPDDPLTLSRVTGLSVRSLRDALAGDFRFAPLHGFVRCDDGRLYHPVLAADALRAWKTKAAREAAAAAGVQKRAVSQLLGSIGRGGRGARPERRGIDWDQGEHDEIPF
jgi:hypothetical protein